MSRMSDLCDIMCDECIQWVPGVDESTRKQRTVLAREGWTTRYGPTNRLEDVCPQCNGSNADYWQRLHRT